MSTIRSLFGLRNVAELTDRLRPETHAVWGRPQSYLPNLDEKRINSVLNIGVGVEVEVEDVVLGRIDVPPGWITTGDTSLRNNGVEYVTAYGARVGQMLYRLSALNRYFERIREGTGNPHICTTGERTSVHVHLDVRNFTTRQIESLILLYTIFEDGLFNFVSEERRHNIYCVPLRETDKLTAPDSLTEMVAHWEKYCAINLSTIRRYGTVEFRHMEGNTDPDYIFTWILLLAMIRDYARRVDNQEIRFEINDLKMESHFKEFGVKVFGPLASRVVSEQQEYDAAASDSKHFFLKIED